MSIIYILISYFINSNPELQEEIDLPVQGESVKPLGKLIIDNEQNNIRKHLNNKIKQCSTREAKEEAGLKVEYKNQPFHLIGLSKAKAPFLFCPLENKNNL